MSRPPITNAILLVWVAAAAACGSGGEGRLGPPTGPGPTELRTTVRVVSATAPDTGVGQVVLQLATGEELQTASDGTVVIRSTAPQSVGIRLLHPSFVERETSVRIPDDRVVVSLIPASHDLAAFEELAPRTSGLQRWTSNPRLQVLSHAVDFAAQTGGFREFPVLDRPLTQAQLECLADGVAAALREMSDGHLSWDSVGIRDVVPGTRIRTDDTPERTILVLPSISVGSPGRGTAYAGADPFVLTRGAIWFDTTLTNFCATFVLYRHELGHALGYQHVTRTRSVMGPGSAPTDFDRESLAILFRRPPGNRTPDRDPSGVTVNVVPGVRSLTMPPW